MRPLAGLVTRAFGPLSKVNPLGDGNSYLDFWEGETRMFGHRHYVPVLKGKRAEFPAVERLRSFDGVAPLWEPVPNQVSDCVPSRFGSFWPPHRPFFIDMMYVDDESMGEGEATSHPLYTCFASLPAEQHGIPVTGTSRSAAYQTAARMIAHERNCGLAIRLLPDDFDSEESLAETLAAVCGYVGLPASQIDIFLDAGAVDSLGAATVAQMHASKMMMLPDLNDWRTVTVLAGAFPRSLAPLLRSTWNSVPRVDWLGWIGLLRIAGRHGMRLPAYGDYAAAHESLPPSGRATILAQLRYSTNNAFLIWKGLDIFKAEQGCRQFFAICQDIITRPEYRGPEFSAGDAEIFEKATTQDSPGNAEVWRRIATNHHLETVMDQIANLP